MKSKRKSNKKKRPARAPVKRNRQTPARTLLATIEAAQGKRMADLVVKNVRILDLVSEKVIEGDIAVVGKQIVGTGAIYHGQRELDGQGAWVVPGFIDAHLHIESSLMTPFGFEAAVLPRGVTSVICDPHEIANVLGIRGIEYFLKASEKTILDVYVMLSSCVPATHLDTAGARITVAHLNRLRRHPSVLGLAEMMNYPGVLMGDPGVLSKIEAFANQHIDGHCPLLRGTALNAYLSTRVRTDHESISREEAEEKLSKGMSLFLREGSVAKNVDALIDVLTDLSSCRVAFCTDDRNPSDIRNEGHIDAIIRKAIHHGKSPLQVYRAASFAAAQIFGLRDRGLIAPGYQADMVLLDDLESCRIRQVYKAGMSVDVALAERRTAQPVLPPRTNTVHIRVPKPTDFTINGPHGSYRLIDVIPGEIVTSKKSIVMQPTATGTIESDVSRDILKIAVIERHRGKGSPAVGLIRGFGIERGAIGSSVGHDSHNLVAVGVTDTDLHAAFLHLKKMKGGFVVVDTGRVVAELPLPIAGLMSEAPFDTIADRLDQLREAARKLGGTLEEPFLQLSFVCLPVIPELKITDRGLVDVEQFAHVELLESKALHGMEVQTDAFGHAGSNV